MSLVNNSFGSHETSDSEDRPPSCMSIENDSGDADEKVDVETPPTPPPYTIPATPPPFLPPPQPSMKLDATVRSNYNLQDSSKITAEVELHRKESNINLPPQHPFLPSPTYPQALNTGNPLHYHYLYYSHMMSPYLLGRSSALPTHTPLPCSSPPDKSRLAVHSPFLRIPSNHSSSLSSTTPARPAPIHPYFSFSTQLSAHL